MNLLDDIPITVSSSATTAGAVGNALPILHEIHHALQRLLECDETTVIDLRAIPFGPGDEERLLSVLGKGEIVATLNALGETTVTETGYPGVWLLDHRNPDDERIALQIEITRIPDILCSRQEDVSDSLERLVEDLIE
ncbi:MAG: hydrogenase expression/formation protein [Candidatus Sedimenticola sp. (ex Thyasira tokunagai)]